jgi:hypothetical protein
MEKEKGNPPRRVAFLLLEDATYQKPVQPFAC